MRRADNFHSRFVAWVKIILPLAALVLLSSLFLVARRPGDPPAIPYAEQDLEQLARDRGIADPHYTGVTEDGHALSVTARRATPRPDNRRVVDVVEVQVEMDTAEGRRIDLSAAGGVIDTAGNEADLSGGVVIDMATGHRVETERMRAALDRADMESLGPVTVTGPNFRADAGKLTVGPGATDNSVIAVFNEGVHLIYTPRME